jgi:hypothetical protein
MRQNRLGVRRHSERAGTNISRPNDGEHETEACCTLATDEDWRSTTRIRGASAVAIGVGNRRRAGRRSGSLLGSRAGEDGVRRLDGARDESELENSKHGGRRGWRLRVRKFPDRELRGCRGKRWLEPREPAMRPRRGEGRQSSEAEQGASRSSRWPASWNSSRTGTRKKEQRARLRSRGRRRGHHSWKKIEAGCDGRRSWGKEMERGTVRWRRRRAPWEGPSWGRRWRLGARPWETGRRERGYGDGARQSCECPWRVGWARVKEEDETGEIIQRRNKKRQWATGERKKISPRRAWDRIGWRDFFLENGAGWWAAYGWRRHSRMQWTCEHRNKSEQCVEARERYLWIDENE